jgi:hypothetical protein
MIFCSPRPLWAAVKAYKFKVATVPHHKGAGLRNQSNSVLEAELGREAVYIIKHAEAGV